MSHRANFVLQDEVWSALQQVPKGERSALVNQALRHWIDLRRRRQAAAELDRLRDTLTPLPGSAEAWIREDRDSHG